MEKSASDDNVYATAALHHALDSITRRPRSVSVTKGEIERDTAGYHMDAYYDGVMRNMGFTSVSVEALAEAEGRHNGKVDPIKLPSSTVNSTMLTTACRKLSSSIRHTWLRSMNITKCRR